MRRLSQLQFPIKLDIGCGKFKLDGFVGFDQLDFGQEIVWNINHGIPLPNDSVCEAYSSHTIEHLEVKELENFFSEVIRVCLPDTILTLKAPHSSDPKAHYLCHYSLWNEKVITGIVEDSPNLELIETHQESYHFVATLKIKK